MTKQLQAVRGMNDILPADTPLWSSVEAMIRTLLTQYGYREMRIPIVENTDLFKRSIGEVTDIVEKEMFTFADRDGDSLTLRPEATAGFVRAAIQHGLLHNQTQRLWCIGPMFRYEKPQKGRSRQFHQLDVEAFGLPGPDIDAELICLLARLWRRLGLEDSTELHLNSLGSSQARSAYKNHLTGYFERYKADLDEDSRRRLQQNPLRILDSKNPALAELIATAPVLLDHLDSESAQHFELLQLALSDAGIEFSINPRLVRGLDYYNRTVFEWVSDTLGAQNTVCGGGRYDGLVAHMGGRSTPGIGFGLGLERLLLMTAEAGFQPPDTAAQVYFIAVGELAQRKALSMAERLRDQLPDLKLHCHCGGGSFKTQFKRADRSGARYALILGEDEVRHDQIAVKPLREPAEQITIKCDQLAEQLAAKLAQYPENE